MTVATSPLVFRCRDDFLVGLLEQPEHASPQGVLIIVGGPQYRVGSHRQFVTLARDLAAAGHACLRFDYRGMGDSGGETRTFEDIADDPKAAIDAFLSASPDVRQLVLVGLCDAASAAMLYAHRDARVSGLILLNPWVRTEQSMAKAYLQHYYWKRLWSRELWQALFKGRLDLARSLRELFASVRGTLARNEPGAAPAGEQGAPLAEPLPDRMRAQFARFTGPSLFILSGDDLTAAEFVDVSQGTRGWRKVMRRSKVSRASLPAADHTFSRRVWKTEVARISRDWLATAFRDRDRT
jgi:exosortase A-associated hydrolase 1